MSIPSDQAHTREIVYEDLAPIEVPIRIGKDRYILREATADAARKWRNSIMSSTTVVDGKVTAVGNLADSEAYLLSMCLYPVRPDTHGTVSNKPVHISTILSWPNRIVRPLFERAKVISGLEEETSGGPTPNPAALGSSGGNHPPSAGDSQIGPYIPVTADPT